MIVGLGSDLTDIRRIERMLARYGDRFVQRIFTDIERNRSESLQKNLLLMPKDLLQRKLVLKL